MAGRGDNRVVGDGFDQMELEASYRSAGHLGFDELIAPAETRNALLVALQRGLYSRQGAAEPVSRTLIMP